jgi:hypothetical protein
MDSAGGQSVDSRRSTYLAPSDGSASPPPTAPTAALSDLVALTSETKSVMDARFEEVKELLNGIHVSNEDAMLRNKAGRGAVYEVILSKLGTMFPMAKGQLLQTAWIENCMSKGLHHKNGTSALSSFFWAPFTIFWKEGKLPRNRANFLSVSRQSFSTGGCLHVQVHLETGDWDASNQ